MKAKIIYNPIAGRGKARRSIERLTRILSCKGYDFDVSHCKRGEPIKTDNIDIIIAVGGDGTLNDVVNALPVNAPPLTLMPTGTSNVFARDISVPKNLNKLVDLIISSKSGYCDLGIERNSNKKFVSMLGAGFDAQVVHKLASRRKGNINQLIYIFYSLEEFPKYKVPKIAVEVDGKRIENSANFVVVSNTGCYGGPLLFTPGAKANDGLFDIFIYKGGYKVDLVRLWGFAFLCYLTRGFIRHSTSIVVKGKSVRLFSDEKVPIQVDGEDVGFTPADIEIIPKGLLVKA